VNYGSVCSGIEAATVAWHPLGWKPAFFVEIAKFPSAVLAARWPGIPNVGDFTELHAPPPIDLLVGGTPCQDFSIAGLREGLAGDRGNLTLEFLRLAQRARPRWVVWENVPGVLSSNGGRDFGAILGGLVELGYGFAYRVLDAQYFGVPQRRRRVFVVGHLGGWPAAAAVLFERASLRGDSPPSRAQGTEVAGTLGAGPEGRGWSDDFERAGAFIPIQGVNTPREKRQNGIGVGSDGDPMYSLTARDQHAVFVGGATSRIDTAPCLSSHGGRFDFDTEALAVSLRGRDGGATAELGDERAMALRASQGGGDKPYVLAFDEAQITSATNRSNPRPGGPAPTLSRESRPALAFHHQQDPISAEVSMPLDASADGLGVMTPRGRVRRLTPRGRVRRLTPRECERLQGFPDDYTLIDGAADGPRYRALGNSMAVPVMRWIGERIARVDALLRRAREAA